MRYKIFASDEGFGHLVRQQAIFEEIRALEPDIGASLQTQHQAGAARWLFGDVEIIEKFNNISWAKTRKGTPDLGKIKAYYMDYISRSEAFISREEVLDPYDFVISDFVYEAFPVAARDAIPAFGVAHFTWDWFFSKLYPVPVRTTVLERWQTYARAADVLYFPHFTPRDIINAYGNKVCEVPLIVRKGNNKVKVDKGSAFKVLIVDSGANVLSSTIERALSDAAHMRDFHFFVSERFTTQSENITKIGKKELMIDYMPQMDLVITRGGFNTISECIAHRTPMLLIGEALNPEMEINMLYLKQDGLGSFVSMERFSKHFVATLSHFIDHEYASLKQIMAGHDFRHDGARVIAEDILNRVKG